MFFSKGNIRTLSNNVGEWGVSMKRILYIFSILCLILISLVSTGYAVDRLYYNDAYHIYEGGEITLNVSGKNINELQMAPVIIEDRTMVPVRDVFEALGSKVIWHDDTCQVEIVNNGVSVMIKIGDRNTYVNGNKVPIADDQPLPMLIGYHADTLKSMVPVRFVAEKLGYNVGWDEKTRTVSISAKNEEQAPPIADDEPIPDKYGVFGKITAVKNGVYDDVYVRTAYGISPKITKYSNPERIVFDFPDAAFSSMGDTVSIDGNCLKSVRYANYENNARVVLDIKSDTQVMVLSSDNGILLRATASPNEQIIYDTFAKRVYFDNKYEATGKPVTNGYMLTFKNLKLVPQKILVNDGNIYEIIIANTASGSTVTVDGSNMLTYSADKGIYKTDKVNPVKPIGERTIIIDAGHGGYDPGAVGYNTAGEAVAYESNINLAIAKLVSKKLKGNGINVIMTRDSDKYISLAERAEIENNSECDLFVSIHCNSIDNSQINGTQVYYNPANEIGTILAENIYNNMVDLTNLAPKHTQNGANLYVIRTTKRPAVLVETAFISNASDRKYLLSSTGQETIAEAITSGIMDTLSEME